MTTTLDSTYAKPFLTVPEQLRRLRGRGMDCGGDDANALAVLGRHGYYRLSGYWHPYRDRPAPPLVRFDADDREIRLDSFVSGTSLAHVVALYEFDHNLRSRMGDALSIIETAFRFRIGHQLGKVDAFAHRDPGGLGAMRDTELGGMPKPTTAYSEWLEEYDRHETRARDDFVTHFRKKYGPHLPIWVATEVMSFGVLSNLYNLQRQSDQEILAARFQINTADGHGDRGALSNWLNSLRNVRNICAHYGRLWNRTFDVVIQAPGQAQKDPESLLSPLVDEGAKHRLYGVLLVMRYLLLNIDPDRTDLVDLVDLIETRATELDFDMTQLGFPADWRRSPIWDQKFALDTSPMLAANLLDRAECSTAVETRAALTGATVDPNKEIHTPEQGSRAKKAAQRKLLKSYTDYKVVIEIKLGATKHYPTFQFNNGKIIDALAAINQKLNQTCGESNSARIAAALIDWWQTPHPGLPPSEDGNQQSPLDLLGSVSEQEFEAIIENSDAVSSFVAPQPH